MSKKVEFESVKINRKIVDKVRENKKKTRIPISAFFEEAANEKLEKEKKKHG